MKYFMSGEWDRKWLKYVVENISPNYYYLMSFYYIRKKMDIFNTVVDNFENTIIDSGAFSLQRGKKADYDEYTKEYAKFIKKNDNDKIIGYFEMDLDIILGEEKVVELRRQLEEVTDKIIPVWHRNRKIEGFKKLCEEYDYVAITNKATDVKPKQLKLFVDYAHKHNTRIHGLGVSAKKYLDNIPFDSVDSVNYQLGVRFSHINGKKIDSSYTSKNTLNVILMGYLQERRRQIYYYDKWKKVCKWE